MHELIAKLEAISRIADVFYGSAVAAALRSFITSSLLDRGELTAEQKAQLDANFADYIAREARLRSEIGS